MLEKAEPCQEKGTFCDVVTNLSCRTPQEAPERLFYFAPYGSPCRTNQACHQYFSGKALCWKDFCNCTASYRVTTQGECDADITVNTAILFIAGSAMALVACSVALIGTIIFAIYSYNCRKERLRQRTELFTEMSKRRRDQSDSPPSSSIDGPCQAVLDDSKFYSLADRPNWKRFRQQFTPHQVANPNVEMTKLDTQPAPPRKPTKKSSEQTESSEDVLYGNLIRAALDRDPGFVRGVANDLAERLRDSHPDDQPFKRKIQDILTEEIQQFAGGDQSELLAVEN